MSRVGQLPIPLPEGVTVELAESLVDVKGPNGELHLRLMAEVYVELVDGTLFVRRKQDTRGHRAAHGLMRRLLANMVEGVSKGFSKTLEISGVGYRAEVRGKQVHLTLGYSHPILYQLPDGVDAKMEGQTKITISGIDRQLVGEVAAGIRKLRLPEPYKGKGIRYREERIRRKAGKAGATA